MEIWGDIWNIHVDIGEYKEYVWILGDMQNMYGNIYIYIQDIRNKHEHIKNISRFGHLKKYREHVWKHSETYIQKYKQYVWTHKET